MALLRKLTYDIVQLKSLDLYNEDGTPKVMAINVPERAWSAQEVVDRGPRITARFKQLMTQISQGALIRNVQILESNISEPIYTDVTAAEIAAIIPPLPPPPVLP